MKRILSLLGVFAALLFVVPRAFVAPAASYEPQCGYEDPEATRSGCPV